MQGYSRAIVGTINDNFSETVPARSASSAEVAGELFLEASILLLPLLEVSTTTDTVLLQCYYSTITILLQSATMPVLIYIYIYMQGWQQAHQ